MKRIAVHKSAISFYSHELTNDGKFDILRNKAEMIRTAKNSLSQTISQDPLKYFEMSKFDICNEFCKQLPDGLSSNEWVRAIFDLHQNYEKKFDQLKSNISFKIAPKYSKKKSKKLGKYRSTDLTKVLSYIARNNITTKEQIQEKINKLPPEIKDYDKIMQFYQTCLNKIDKFGQRLFDLARSRLQRILNKCKPINFESLTYSNLNQFDGGLVVKRANSSNKSDDYNAYFMIAAINSGIKTNRIAIPVKYSKKYHGSLHQFSKKNIVYKIIFEIDRIRLVVTRDKEYIENYSNMNITGIDINTKNNLFNTENLELDFDRKLVKKAIKVFDAFKDIEHPTIKEQKRVLHYRRAIAQNTKNNIVKMAVHLKSNGIDHVVIEDLVKFKSNNVKLSWMNGIKTNRLNSILKLGSIGNWISSIFEKKEIQVTIAHSEYSSQECNKCNYIDKGNRKSQELFVCLCCGHTDNADSNAYKNLATRISEDVLRESMFEMKNGRYTKIPMKSEEIRKLLLFRHVKTSSLKSTMFSEELYNHPPIH